MKFTLGQANKETGVAKSTLSRDVKNGKISAEKQPDGSYQIDASELFRVYPRVSQETPETGSMEQGSNDPQPHKTVDGTEGLRAELQILRERLQMTGTMHETEKALLNERIEELRQDREDFRAERDKLLATLQEQAISVKLLTDTRPNPPSSPPPSSSSPPSPPTNSQNRPFWSGLFGRRAG